MFFLYKNVGAARPERVTPEAEITTRLIFLLDVLQSLAVDQPDVGLHGLASIFGILLGTNYWQ